MLSWMELTREGEHSHLGHLLSTFTVTAPQSAEIVTAKLSALSPPACRLTERRSLVRACLLLPDFSRASRCERSA